MKFNADWQIENQTDEYILIRDLNLGNRSVTNDVENVVKKILPQLNGRRLFYRDSMGVVDEIIIEEGEFFEFKPGFKNKFGIK